LLKKKKKKSKESGGIPEGFPGTVRQQQVGKGYSKDQSGHQKDKAKKKKFKQEDCKGVLGPGKLRGRNGEEIEQRIAQEGDNGCAGKGVRTGKKERVARGGQSIVACFPAAGKCA